MDHHHHALVADPEFSFVVMLISSFGISLHCASMCGPLLAAQFSLGQQSLRAKVWRMAKYHAGRGLSYTLAGACCGWLGGRLTGLQKGLAYAGEILTLGIGLLLLAFALQQYKARTNSSWIPQATSPEYDNRLARSMRTLRNHWRKFESRFWRNFSKVFALLPHHLRDFTLGFVTVLLPCMTLTPALGLSLASGDPKTGSSMMFAFFLGTVPVMSLAALVTQLPLFWLRSFRSLVLALAGVICILRAFGIHLWMN